MRIALGIDHWNIQFDHVFSFVGAGAGTSAGALSMAPNGIQADKSQAAAEPTPPELNDRNDWQAIFLTLLTPAILISGFIYLLMQPQWEDSGSIEWLDGLVAVIPLEFVRIIMLRILRDTYHDYQNPLHAVKFFLLSMAILVALCIVMGFMVLKLEMFRVLADPHAWALLAPPLFIVVLDGVINVAFFRGDASRVAAQFDAAADDAQSWFDLALYPTPLAIAAVWLVLFFLHTRGVALLSSFPEPNLELFRSACLVYVIIYFIGKSVLLVHVHTAHFFRSGNRLLAGRWVDFLGGKNAEARDDSARSEVDAALRRLRALHGQPFEPAESKRQRRKRRRE